MTRARSARPTGKKPVAAARRAPKSAAEPAPPSRAQREAAFLSGWLPRLAKLDARPLLKVGAAEISLSRPVFGWLLITTGLWEHGVELTLRAPRAKDEEAPPAWMISLLTQLISTTGRGQVPGLQQSLALEHAPEGAPDVLGCAFLADPLLTNVGEIKPLLAVGLLADEERLVREWNPAGFLEVLAKSDDQLRTDPERASLLMSPRARTQIEQRVDREGSSMQVMHAATSTIDGPKWTLSVEAVPTFIGLLKGRTAHQRPFTVRGQQSVQVVPADVPAFSAGEAPTLKLTQMGARSLRAQLRARPGRYELDVLPGFTLEVV